LLALALASGCGSGHATSGPAVLGAKPAGEGRAKLWLTAVNEKDALTLTVNYEKGATPAPRVADIRIAHTEALGLASAIAGASATASGKELTTQEPTPGLVRLILLSRDTKELGTGELAQLKFKKGSGDHAKLDILMDKPVFAPAEAMQGLVIGDPLEM
jgi:hypothetical protein